MHSTVPVHNKGNYGTGQSRGKPRPLLQKHLTGADYRFRSLLVREEVVTSCLLRCFYQKTQLRVSRPVF